jgi:hypothetical protein
MRSISLVRPLNGLFRANTASTRTMGTIADGVDFDTVAREWRFKWSPDQDKKSLAEAQKVLNNFKTSIHNVAGVKNVQRVVCGGCHDFKVIVALPADKFGAWVSGSDILGTLQFIRRSLGCFYRANRNLHQRKSF